MWLCCATIYFVQEPRLHRVYGTLRLKSQRTGKSIHLGELCFLIGISDSKYIIPLRHMKNPQSFTGLLVIGDLCRDTGPDGVSKRLGQRAPSLSKANPYRKDEMNPKRFKVQTPYRDSRL